MLGSTDRHLIQLFHPGINTRFGRTLLNRYHKVAIWLNINGRLQTERLVNLPDLAEIWDLISKMPERMSAFQRRQFMRYGFAYNQA